MSKKIFGVLKVLVSLVLAAILLYLVFKNVDWIEFWYKAQTVNLTWVVLSISISLIAFFARAYRWNILLEPIGYRLKTSRTTLAVMIGYMANLAIPRMGEISRCAVLSRNDKVKMAHGFGSVVAERIMDLITLFILILIGLIVEFKQITIFLKEAYADLNVPAYLIYAVIGVVLFGSIFLIIVIKKRSSMTGRFAEVIGSFVDGLLSLSKIKNVSGFIFSTLLIWLVYFFMTYVVIFSLPETASLDLGAGLLLLVTGGIALSIPVQSGFGTYHGMVAGLLLLYDIDKTTGLFFATLLHTSQIVSIACFGAIAFLLSSIIRRKEAKTA